MPGFVDGSFEGMEVLSFSPERLMRAALPGILSRSNHVNPKS
jgi:hypothetical protein